MTNKTLEGIGHFFSEPAVAYSSGSGSLSLVHRSREGVTKKDFIAFSKSIQRSVLDLAQILTVSYSTLTKKSRYNKATSEHILALHQLFAYGVDVFGDIQRFNSWLDEPRNAYEGSSLYSLLDTVFGIEIVSSELRKIDYGLPV